MSKEIHNIDPDRPRLSVSSFNEIAQLSRAQQTTLINNSQVSSVGILTRPARRPIIPQVTSDLWIFKVQSATAAPGIYNCFQQTAPGVWDTSTVEVLNLVENDTLEDYTPALAVEDRIAAWLTKDEAGTDRWVGIPNTSPVRMARTTEAAGASQQITCNLILNDGETEGPEIEVHCRITRDITSTEYNLNQALPRLATGDYIFVENISGKWWCVTVFQVNEICICNTG